MKKLMLGLAMAFAATAEAAEPIMYLDWDATQKKLVEKTCTAYDLVTAGTTAFEDAKWYVVADKVVIENGGNIKVNGSAHLILCDNASLTIKSVADSAAAIDVSVSGSATNSLAIYGQQGGSGVLSANGSIASAGIGGGAYVDDGVTVVNGGSVMANSVKYAEVLGIEVGETVKVTVRSKKDFAYYLVRVTFEGGELVEDSTAGYGYAEYDTLTLEDENPPAGSGFYVVQEFEL